MIPFLIFYYLFSVLFEIGYCNFSELKTWVKIAALFVLILIVAPFAMPINLGRCVYDYTK